MTRSPEVLASPCADCGEDVHDLGEYYMVHNEVWAESDGGAKLLCIGCLETRLGRELTPADFNDAPLNSIPWNKGLRLQRRLGWIT